jgi:hypothetical protein
MLRTNLHHFLGQHISNRVGMLKHRVPAYLLLLLVRHRGRNQDIEGCRPACSTAASTFRQTPAATWTESDTSAPFRTSVFLCLLTSNVRRQALSVLSLTSPGTPSPDFPIALFLPAHSFLPQDPLTAPRPTRAPFELN